MVKTGITDIKISNKCSINTPLHIDLSSVAFHYFAEPSGVALKNKTIIIKVNIVCLHIADLCFDTKYKQINWLTFLKVELLVYIEPLNKMRKNMRRPGVEPGSTAWKATMLAITPPTVVRIQRL